MASAEEVQQGARNAALRCSAAKDEGRGPMLGRFPAFGEDP